MGHAFIMLIIENNIIPFGTYDVVNICGVLFVKKGTELTPEILQHERIHSKQIFELFIVGFYLWYVVEFAVRYLRLKDNGRSRWKRAYRAISFEREAYFNQSRTNYFALRENYQFVTYL